jgi:hypothetical protein
MTFEEAMSKAAEALAATEAAAHDRERAGTHLAVANAWIRMAEVLAERPVDFAAS